MCLTEACLDILLKAGYSLKGDVIVLELISVGCLGRDHGGSRAVFWLRECLVITHVTRSARPERTTEKTWLRSIDSRPSRAHRWS